MNKAVSYSKQSFESWNIVFVPLTVLLSNQYEYLTNTAFLPDGQRPFYYLRALETSAIGSGKLGFAAAQFIERIRLGASY